MAEDMTVDVTEENRTWLRAEKKRSGGGRKHEERASDRQAMRAAVYGWIMNDVKPKKKKDSGVIGPSVHIIKTEKPGLSNWDTIRCQLILHLYKFMFPRLNSFYELVQIN